MESDISKLVSMEKKKPLAVILAVSANGLSFIRSLGRKGIPVIGLESSPAPGLFSRYCGKVVLPDIVDHEGAWLDALSAIGERLSCKGALIPTGDAHVVFVSKHREELSQHFHFVLASDRVLDSIVDKRLQYELAQRIGVPIPQTFFPENLEKVSDIGARVRYPCILKPYRSHLWRKYRKDKYDKKKLLVARSPQELTNCYAEMVQSGQAIMIQEKIPGGDDHFYGLLTYYNRKSEALAVFTKRKLRQFPMNYGDGSLQVSIWVPEVAELGNRLLKAMNYQGLAGVEFKWDPRDGQFKLIEINPRSVTGEDMTVKSGVDIPFIAYLDIIGERVEPVSTFREGVKWMSLNWDIMTYFHYRKAKKLTFAGWLSSLKGVRSFAFFSLSDPLPFLMVLRQLIKAGLRKLPPLARSLFS